MNDDEFIDYYARLKITGPASAEEIEEARLRELKYWHPDNYARRPEYLAEAEFMSKKINEAYELLKNPEFRRGYDQIYVEWKAWRRSAATQPRGISEDKASGKESTQAQQSAARRTLLHRGRHRASGKESTQAQQSEQPRKRSDALDEDGLRIGDRRASAKSEQSRKRSDALDEDGLRIGDRRASAKSEQSRKRSDALDEDGLRIGDRRASAKSEQSRKRSDPSIGPSDPSEGRESKSGLIMVPVLLRISAFMVPVLLRISAFIFALIACLVICTAIALAGFVILVILMAIGAIGAGIESAPSGD